MSDVVLIAYLRNDGCDMPFTLSIFFVLCNELLKTNY